MKKLKLWMLGMSLLALWAPTIVHAQVIRLSSQFRRWDNTADEATATPFAGGSIIYNQTVTVPPGKNVLFVTYATTGFSGCVNGPPLCGSSHICLVDSVNCNLGTVLSNSPGWIPTQPGGGFNAITYEWCANITPQSVATLHSIQLRLASNDGVSAVENAGSHIFIDTTKLAGGCTESTNPPD